MLGKVAERLDRALAGYWLRAANQVGRGAVVIGRPFVSNEGSIRIGDHFRLSSRPTQSHLVAKPGGSIDVGHRVLISFGAAISSERAVSIGDDTRLGPFSVIMDSDFHVAGDRNAVAEATPVRIGRGVVIGTRVTVLRGSDIGDGARVQSGAVVSGVVPAGAVVGGVPARPIARGAGAGDIDVPSLIQRVLSLPKLPASTDGPDQIAAWDSLGTLKLLLALEETFGVALKEEDVRSARSAARLTEIVEIARYSM